MLAFQREDSDSNEEEDEATVPNAITEAFMFAASEYIPTKQFCAEAFERTLEEVIYNAT